MMVVWHLLPYIEHVIILIAALAAALVLSVVQLFLEFGAFSPSALLFIAVGSILYAMWWVVVRLRDLYERLWPPKPMRYGQFVELFQALDKRLYQGLLWREGVNPCLADIKPGNPHIFLRAKAGPNGEAIFGGTYVGLHDYSHVCREIVVNSNQSNREMRRGLLIEMGRAAHILRQLRNSGISDADVAAMRLETSVKLLKEHAEKNRSKASIVG